MPKSFINQVDNKKTPLKSEYIKIIIFKDGSMPNFDELLFEPEAPIKIKVEAIQFIADKKTNQPTVIQN